MSRIALPFFVVGCALCALAATADVTHEVRVLWIVAAIACAVTAVVAWIDLVVIARRMRAERTGPSRTR